MTEKFRKMVPEAVASRAADQPEGFHERFVVYHFDPAHRVAGERHDEGGGRRPVHRHLACSSYLAAAACIADGRLSDVAHGDSWRHRTTRSEFCSVY